MELSVDEFLLSVVPFPLFIILPLQGMVLQASERETAYVFATEGDSDSVLVDLKGTYVLLDGGPAPIPLIKAFRKPTAVVLSAATPSTIPNAVSLNQGALVSVVGSVPSVASLKDSKGDHAEAIRQLHTALVIPPIPAHVGAGNKPEAILLYKDVSEGTLTLYVLAGDAKDAETYAKAFSSSPSEDALSTAAASSSSIFLLVWQPSHPDLPIKRILHTGSAPLARIQSALDRARSLPFVQSSVVTGTSLKAPRPPPSRVPAKAVPPPKAPAPKAAPAPRAPPAARPASKPVPPPVRTPSKPASAPTAPRPAAARAPVPTKTGAVAAKTAAVAPTRTIRPSLPARTAPAPVNKAKAAPKEEVAKKAVVGKQEGARGSKAPVPSAPPAPSTAPSAPSAAPAVAVAATAVAAAVAADALIDVHEEPHVSPPSPQAPVLPPTLIDTTPSPVHEPRPNGDLLGGGGMALPGGLPIPASPTLIPATPQPPLSPEEEAKDEPLPVSPEPVPHDIEEPIPSPVRSPSPVPVAPAEGDLIGEEFKQPFVPQEPGHDGLLDAVEEPPRLMKISMDTEQLEAELGLTQPVEAEAPAPVEDLLSSPEDYQRKLSAAAEESLLSSEAAPFIAGLASTVVESATIDGAKANALESLLAGNNIGSESPTGDKLMSFRSSGFENPDAPREVKYEETDPAIDGVLTSLAEESDKVGHNGHHNGEKEAVAGNGWPEGVSMNLTPPKAKEFKFHIGGPVHVDLCTVPHRGSVILLPDAASSLEFFSSVRSSSYILPSGGDVPEHVLQGFLKGKGAWAANVPSQLLPTRANQAVSKWASDNGEVLSELGLSVGRVAAENTEINIPTDPSLSAKALTIVL